ncbi:MAG: IS1 family transposase [Cyanobacteria bacterium P01_G01_bin.39]
MTVWIAVTCPGCHSTDIVKNGKTPHGKQRYKCRNQECPRCTFIEPI